MTRSKVLQDIGAIVSFLFFLAGCSAPVTSPPAAATVEPSPTPPPAVPSSTPENTRRSLIIPVGRTAVAGGNDFEVLIDGAPYDPEPAPDGYGGYWIEVPYDTRENRQVALRFSIRNGLKELYRAEGENREKWLAPSALINSDDPVLIREAQRLTADGGTAAERARKIHEFVIAYLTFQPYGRHYLTSASETYGLGYGTCVNYARLFVALSRAANVPARTVWGATFNDGAYEHHHEWAEYQDDDGYWHPLDLSYTTSFELADVNYLDLIYASEENPLYEQSRNEQYSKKMTRFIVYDTTAEPYDGRLGFTILENDFPTSYLVENVFVLADIPKLIPQMVP